MGGANWTIDEAPDGEELTDCLEATEVVGKVIAWYNHERLHSALGFLRPVDYCRGDPEALQAVRRLKLARARHRRREKNPQLRQPTLPFVGEEIRVQPEPGFCARSDETDRVKDMGAVSGLTEAQAEQRLAE